jgi:type II secretory pathway component PulK
VTLWIILALTALVLSLAHEMRVEAQCSANSLAAAQADAVQQGAIQYVLARVDSLEGELPLAEDTPAEGVQIGDGAFWILHNSSDHRTLEYGITDEAGKVNLNANVPNVSEMLQKLPGMTSELAASIVDWQDGDDEATPGGAESQYYLLQADPYECKNGPFESVGELMLVRDMTPEVFLGEDANRNSVLDGNENDAAARLPADDDDGQLGLGIADLVTVRSREANISADGQRRINVNDARPQQMAAVLGGVLTGDRLAQVQATAMSGRPYLNMIDFYFRGGLTMDEFRRLTDKLTTDSSASRRGLVNINSAPAEVLACLPGLDDNDAAALVAWRSQAGGDLSSIAWLAEALPREKAIAAGGSVTTRTYYFSADIVAVSPDGRAFRRCRVEIDATTSPPKVVFYQDLTALGWPLEPEIRRGLRSGQTLDEIEPNRTLGA